MRNFCEMCGDDNVILVAVEALTIAPRTMCEPCAAEHKSEADSPPTESDTSGEEKPKVVCLCGSTRFAEAWKQVHREESLAGNIVLSVGVMIQAGDEPVRHDGPEKRQLDELHLRKIDMADEVVVIAPGEYIGDSTSREIGYALERDIPIRYRYDLPPDTKAEAEERAPMKSEEGVLSAEDVEEMASVQRDYEVLQARARGDFPPTEEQAPEPPSMPNVPSSLTTRAPDHVPAEPVAWGPAPSFGGCMGCGRPYSDDGFMDFIVPDNVWDKISPTGDSGGLLCPGCIIGHIIQADISWVNDGVNFVGTFESGPLVGQSLHFGETPKPPEPDARLREAVTNLLTNAIMIEDSSYDEFRITADDYDATRTALDKEK
jgi:hypothetical protein